MVGRYVPAQGDIVFLQFNPQSGQEQAGARPAIVLSPRIYNQKVGLMIACPVTAKSKGYPMEVPLPPSMKTHGVILADHVKSLDWRARKARFIERAPKQTLAQVLRLLLIVLEQG
jgi:mRNA interferase MazF